MNIPSHSSMPSIDEPSAMAADGDAGTNAQASTQETKFLGFTLPPALSDMARLQKMSQESFRIVSEEINIQKMADVFVDALNSVV